MKEKGNIVVKEGLRTFTYEKDYWCVHILGVPSLVAEGVEDDVRHQPAQSRVINRFIRHLLKNKPPGTYNYTFEEARAALENAQIEHEFNIQPYVLYRVQPATNITEGGFAFENLFWTAEEVLDRASELEEEGWEVVFLETTQVDHAHLESRKLEEKVESKS